MHAEAGLPVHVVRARRTAAASRGLVAVLGMAVAASEARVPTRWFELAGFTCVLLTAVVQFWLIQSPWLKLEEAFALPAILIVGLGDQHVTVADLLWLAAVVCGVLARGGRVHWLGRTVVLVALAIPVIRYQRLELDYAALCAGALSMLVTCGRVTEELRKLLGEARYAADHDSLTGALARAAFRQRLDDRAGRAEDEEMGRALLLIDLDGFGQINKARGHTAGDGVLADAADRIREIAGPDALIGRLGGDEFGVISDCDDDERLACELVASLHECNPAVTASVGIARAPQDGRDAEALLRAADIALRVAKRSGRGQVSAYAGDSLSDAGPSGAQATLTRLIAGEDLAIVVQPIVEADSGHTHAFEALARFRAGATSSPLHWFALADEFGLRAELELACLRASLELLDSLPDEARLTVNLSGSLLHDPRVAQTLWGTPTLSRLVVELTENTLVEETSAFAAVFAELRARGARLAVDDMGAGYAGLRQITAVRADYLKLDRSLVTGIETSRERQALVAALLSYCERTGAALVAEGVETEAELEAVQALGVPLVQGYLFGRPADPWPLVDRAPSLRHSR